MIVAIPVTSLKVNDVSRMTKARKALEREGHGNQIFSANLPILSASSVKGTLFQITELKTLILKKKEERCLISFAPGKYKLEVSTRLE